MTIEMTFAVGGAIGTKFILVLVLLSIIIAVTTGAAARGNYDVMIRNSGRRCPSCNRMFIHGRELCRSCEYRYKTSRESEGKRQSRGSAGSGPAPTKVTIVPISVSHWDTLHRNPHDIMSENALLRAVADTLTDRLTGPKKIEHEVVMSRVILRRAELHYASQIKIFVGEERHGFEVSVPAHGFKIRITCPRIVPKDVVAAPWDDLLKELCEVDRSVIRTRMSKSQPLSYVSKDGEHPSLRVEVLSRRATEERPRQLPGS
jgi:hypothetical protein